MPKIPRNNLEGYKMLFDLELSIRIFIKFGLEEKSKNLNIGGWLKLIPNKIIEDCESRRDTETSLQYQDFKNYELLDYSSLEELKKIITKNWDYFQIYFIDQNTIITKFNELKPIRHTIAHNRRLCISEFDRLKILYKDIKKAINSK